jgi:hypothetical protein
MTDKEINELFEIKSTEYADNGWTDKDQTDFAALVQKYLDQLVADTKARMNDFKTIDDMRQYFFDRSKVMFYDIYTEEEMKFMCNLMKDFKA